MKTYLTVLIFVSFLCCKPYQTAEADIVDDISLELMHQIRLSPNDSAVTLIDEGTPRVEGCTYDNQRVESIDWSPRENLLALGIGIYNLQPPCISQLFAGAIKVYDFSSSEPVLLVEIRTAHLILSVKFEPEANLLAAGLFENQVRIYETSNWRRQATITDGIERKVESVDFHSNILLAVGGSDLVARLFNPETGYSIANFTATESGIVHEVSFNPDASRLAVARQVTLRSPNLDSPPQTSSIQVYDLETNQLEVYLLRDKNPTTARFSPLTGRLGILGYDLHYIYLQLYDFDSRNTRHFNVPPMQDYYDIAFDQEETLIAMGGLNSSGDLRGILVLYNLNINDPILIRSGFDSRIMSLDFNFDDTLLAVGEQSSTLSIFQVIRPTPAPTSESTSPFQNETTTVFASPPTLSLGAIVGITATTSFMLQQLISHTGYALLPTSYGKLLMAVALSALPNPDLMLIRLYKMHQAACQNTQSLVEFEL